MSRKEGDLIEKLNSLLSWISGSADWIMRETAIERKSSVACVHSRA